MHSTSSTLESTGRIVATQSQLFQTLKTTMAEPRLFKELELGFRELFRILIPGAFVVTLAQFVAPKAPITQAMTASAASGLATTFFCGLACYALRIHERWFPFFLQFENKRAALNEEIARITARKSAKDNVDIYKYS